jgi:hypothetical protein
MSSMDCLMLGWVVVQIGISMAGGYAWGHCNGYLKRMDDEEKDKK